MSPAETETPNKSLPPPWDRIFSLGTRTFVWGLLLGVLYILRPFFLLIFLTFVFAYIQAHGVDGLAHRIKNRVARVSTVGLVFLGTILATVFTLAPSIEQEGYKLLRNSPQTIADADKALNTWLRGNPQIWNYLLDYLKKQEESGDKGKPATGDSGKPATNGGKANSQGQDKPADQQTGAQQPEPPQPELEPHLIKGLVDSITGLGSEGSPKNLSEMVKNIADLGSSVLGYVSSFLLSLLFSFLIVLDLPKISRGISGLANTKVGFIFDEVADNIATFGKVLGRALEAQLFIAVVNTILTALGIYFLGLPSLLFLSAIVFFCSFIPVAGVFISSTPICLLALQSGGLGMMVLGIGLILLIHAIETYILNPRIYGHHMRMNPVFVLIVLTVAGKLFGVWGLILGIPIVNYFFRHAIRFPQDQPKDFEQVAA